MEAVAREAGVTKPILYRVFEDRDGLVRAVGDRFATELGAVLEKALSEGGGAGWDDPEGVLRATIDAYVAIIDNDPEVYRFLTAGLARDPELPVVSLAYEVARNIAVVLAARLRDIGVDDRPAELWAHGIVGMVHMAGDWWVDRRTFTRLTLYAGPYVAGPYAEGAYEVNVNMDAAVLATIKPQFREAFSARN